MDMEKIREGVRLILDAIGEDATRPGLMDTPDRVARMYAEIFSGMVENPDDLVKGVPGEQHDEIVLIRDIPFYSVCEHHMIPFLGTAHVAYLPSGTVVGLSKIARVVSCFARRLQLQERLTTDIAECLMRTLNPLGVMVVIEAEHLCMTMRGVKTPGAKTVTSAVRGIFRTNPATRQEALALLERR